MRASAILITTSLALAATAANAAIINVFDNKAAFLSATGATSIATIPNAGSQGTGPSSLPDPVSTPRITFDSTSGTLFFGTLGLDPSWFTGGQWSTVIPGHDIAISGPEEMDVMITLGSPGFALGFDFHEPSIDRTGLIITDTCNIPGGGNDCIDSTFMIELLNGAVPVGSFTFNAADDVLAFVGVHTNMAFDTARITETIGAAENEYFGEFYAGTTAAVPEPASIILVSLGLAGIGVVGRRKRRVVVGRRKRRVVVGRRKGRVDVGRRKRRVVVGRRKSASAR